VRQTIVSQSLNIPTSSIFKGIDNEQKALPEVICYAEEAEQYNKDLDWWKVTAHIAVNYRAYTSDRNETMSTANNIFDAFYNLSGSLNLTNATCSFTCADMMDRKYRNTVEQDTWVQMISFTLIASPAH